jgi:glycosyltransferase involved in cell wall biosynthesis
VRILFVNAFHWLKGGVERTLFDETRWLGAAGHEVAHLAIRDARNAPSPTAEFFAPAVDWGEGAPLAPQLARLPSAIWSLDAEACMRRLLERWRPDVAHVHAPSRYLTPAVLRPLEALRVPVVMTLHDYKPWCTNRLLFAHGEVCTRCRGGAHWHAAATACVQDSRAKSAIAALEAYVHDAVGAYRMVRRWIAPSRFAHDTAISLGADAAHVRVVPHGVERPAARGTRGESGRYALFFGRLSEEKGVRLLPEVARALAPVPLMVAGEGPLSEWLRAAGPDSLRLLGHVEDASLAALRAEATAVLMPSRFPETFGYSAAEALLDARPLVAARIGALPELIEHEVSGLLVEPGDLAGLIAASRRALDDPAAAAWGATARERVSALTDPARHVKALVAVYEEAMS